MHVAPPPGPLGSTEEKMGWTQAQSDGINNQSNSPQGASDELEYGAGKLEAIQGDG